jgi:hypothetical protein
MRVKYLGKKPKVTIVLPFGAQSHREIKKLVFADPFAEIPEEDALKLIAFDPANYQIVKEELPVAEIGTEIHHDAPAPKKRGRPAKVANA